MTRTDIVIGLVILQLFIGGMTLLAEIEPGKPFNCQYHSIASYFPGRMVLCELFRNRWP